MKQNKSIREDTIKPTPVKPGTKPGVRPSKPGIVPKKRPSVVPAPKATLEDIVEKYLSLVDDNDIVAESIEIYEDYSKAKKILKKRGINQDDKVYKEITKLLAKKPGYVGKFVEFAFEQHASIPRLKRLFATIMDFLQTYNRKLHIDNFKNIEELEDHLYEEIKNIKFKKLLKGIPKAVRPLMTDEILDKISSNINIIDEVQGHFQREGNYYAHNNVDGVVEAVESIIATYSIPWDFRTYYNYFKNFTDKDSEVVYTSDDEDVMVVRIKSWDAANDSAKQGYSSLDWCISRASSTFYNYVALGLTNQYYIYDFSLNGMNELSKIAATVNRNGTVKEIKDRKNQSFNEPINYLKTKLDLNIGKAED